MIDRLSRASCLNCLVSSPADLDDHKSRTDSIKKLLNCAQQQQMKIYYSTPKRNIYNTDRPDVTL